MKLRTKLVSAWMGAGLALALIVLWAASAVTERAILEQARERIECSRTLLNAALAAALMQKDYATLQQILDETRQHAGVSYLVVSDRMGRHIVGSGTWAEADLAKQPTGDAPLLDADGQSRFHVRVDLQYAGQPLGSLRYAQSAAFLSDARTALYREAGVVGALALALGAAVLGAIALAVTRPLARLTEASARVSRGEYQVEIPSVGKDEVGQLAAHFNRMCAAIRERMAALAEREASEKQFRLQAEAASRAKSTFLAITSHEIRTPLNGILGIADLLARTRLEPQQRKYCETIVASGRQLHRMLSDILDLAKIEAGKLGLESTDFDLGALLDELASEYASLAFDRGLLFDVDRDASLPAAVRGDPTRLRQALGNILNNALKFTREGKVAFRCARLAPTRADAKVTIRFSVIDTGIGIPEDKIGSVFDPFFQSEDSTVRLFGGSGLGLCITRHLVECMGGVVHVASTVGSGTSFTVDVPLLPVEHRSTRPAAARTGLASDRLRGKALVVEDHPVNQLVVAEMLRKMGLSVSVAENGALAVEAARNDSFDLVLMDCQMPVMDGYEATRRIRAEDSSSRRIPIVALTANAFDEDRRACLACGMDDFLAKPVTYDALYAKVRTWLASADDHGEERVERELPGDPATPSAFDRGAILTLAQATSGRNLARILRAFVDSMPSTLSGLRSNAGLRDFDGLRQVVHGLKSTARTVGLVRVAELAEEADRLARSKDEAAFDHTPGLAAAIEEGVGWLQQQISAVAPIDAIG